MPVNFHRQAPEDLSFPLRGPISNFLVTYFFFLPTKKKKIGLYWRRKGTWKSARKKISWLKISVRFANTIDGLFIYLFIFYPTFFFFLHWIPYDNPADRKSESILFLLFIFCRWKKKIVIGLIFSWFFFFFHFVLELIFCSYSNAFVSCFHPEMRKVLRVRRLSWQLGCSNALPGFPAFSLDTRRRPNSPGFRHVSRFYIPIFLFFFFFILLYNILNFSYFTLVNLRLSPSFFSRNMLHFFQDWNLHHRVWRWINFVSNLKVPLK